MQRFLIFHRTVRYALFGSTHPCTPRYFGTPDIKLFFFKRSHFALITSTHAGRWSGPLRTRGVRLFCRSAQSISIKPIRISMNFPGAHRRSEGKNALWRSEGKLNKQKLQFSTLFNKFKKHKGNNEGNRPLYSKCICNSYRVTVNFLVEYVWLFFKIPIKEGWSKTI